MSGESLITPTAVTAGLFVPLALLDLRMQATGGGGIIPFELAGPARSEQVLRAWGVGGRRAAVASLVLDFPYLVAYTTLNVRLTRRVSGSSGGDTPTPSKRVSVIGSIQVLAGVCDAIENTALLGVVARKGDPRLATLARRAALAKFAGLATGWLYIAAAAVAGRGASGSDGAAGTRV